MAVFVPFQGIVAPLDRSNVDTDAILPKQYLKSIERTGFGITLFDDWRYLDPGSCDSDHQQRRCNPDFVLNQPRYQNCEILLVRKNFGCGSSREHAVWALLEYGIKVILGESFAEIFSTNAAKNGLLLITLPAPVIADFFSEVSAHEGYTFQVDLSSERLLSSTDKNIPFKIDPDRKTRFLNGLDEIDMILQHADRIRAYEEMRRDEAPWLFERIKI